MAAYFEVGELFWLIGNSSFDLLSLRNRLDWIDRGHRSPRERFSCGRYEPMGRRWRTKLHVYPREYTFWVEWNKSCTSKSSAKIYFVHCDLPSYINCRKKIRLGDVGNPCSHHVFDFTPVSFIQRTKYTLPQEAGEYAMNEPAYKVLWFGCLFSSKAIHVRLMQRRN